MGQLWKGRVESKETLGAGFSSLLLRVAFCLCDMQSVQGKGAKQIWYWYYFVLSLFKLLKAPFLSPFFHLFFSWCLCSSHITRWRSSFFMCWAPFCHLCCIFKNSCCQCLSFTLIWSFWHVTRPHSSFFRSFLFPQPAYFTWQGQFSAVSWWDIPTLSFSYL